mmetsp:Transcript_72/g.153  ORF Transcript_72/g.153 Transcript_72/m.153 type:complete len:325 (+) Transcript_72:66-1040(+)|eukprot:CAMPEP_0178820330 /NCGR_PEP_ID=MMETSP0746-20121128/3457_1 /TAXON_ID=913974 /ORGANISM="Nitzschia punctata, Strain CCMP561" /LENGTH=324 /DNA_ID=CAMNT_0020481673 /DNA_START=65 /DNA_END=1039 /DNA_ORIENTATION=-
MTKPQERAVSTPRRNRWKQKKVGIEGYIPPYLRRFVTPYHGDFCYTRTYHFRLVAQLMMEGFLPIATDGVMLPKLHSERCVVTLPESLHISKSTRKKSKKFRFSVNRAFDRVVEECRRQHGHRCWLYPELVEVFKQIHQAGQVNAVVVPKTPNTDARQESCPVRLYSIEVWNDETGDLVAGELGYTVGSIYTSLTGFSSQDSAGSVQLAALGRLLSTLGFSLWDLGMDMAYKQSLGSHLMARDDFLEHVKNVRVSKGHLVLPAPVGIFNCKDLIDQVLSAESMLATSGLKSSVGPELRHSVCHTPPPASQGGSSPEPNKKKRRN